MRLSLTLRLYQQKNSMISVYMDKNTDSYMGTKVNFILSPEIVSEATSGVVLGEFNNWDFDNGITLKKQKDGSLKATTTLEPGRTYQYRYLLNDGRWVNDARAQSYVPVDGLYVDNCVITVPVEEEKEPKAAKEKTTKIKTSKKPAKQQADDLTKIAGIDKKIVQLLAAESITSYKHLAKASAKKLKAILEAAGTKYKNIETDSWPAQAKLAATGKGEETSHSSGKQKEETASGSPDNPGG